MSEEDTKKKAGRPKGARSKTALMKAQFLVDDFSIEAIQNMIALATNDADDKLNMKGKVPATIVLSANKNLLDKALANEKDKLGDTGKQPSTSSEEEQSTDSEGKVVPIGPKVYASAE